MVVHLSIVGTAEMVDSGFPVQTNRLKIVHQRNDDELNPQIIHHRNYDEINEKINPQLCERAALGNRTLEDCVGSDSSKAIFQCTISK